MKSRALPTLPFPVVRALKKLGADISDARRRRRIPTALMAARAMISRSTLRRVEKGSPEVSMGIYATILFILGLDARLGDLVDIRKDDVGIGLDEARLPKRIHMPREKKKDT